jgi:hypothetical protein
MNKAKDADRSVAGRMRCCQFAASVYDRAETVDRAILAPIIVFLPRICDRTPLGTIIAEATIPERKTIFPVSDGLAPRLSAKSERKLEFRDWF